LKFFSPTPAHTYTKKSKGKKIGLKTQKINKAQQGDANEYQ